MNPFYEQIYDLVRQVPPGRVISYGQIARVLGRPRSARVVGWAMHTCPIDIPWQRVVMKDGTVTGGEFAEVRRRLLEEEGVTFLPDGRVDMEKYAWI